MRTHTRSKKKRLLSVFECLILAMKKAITDKKKNKKAEKE